MKKILGLIALTAAMAPSAAFAGFGMTASLGGLSDGTSWAPSMDWRSRGFVVNLNAVDLIGGVPDDRLNLGAGFSVIAMKREIAQEVEGTLMPGARIRYAGFLGDTADALSTAKLQDSGFNVTGQLRMGMEMKKGMGFGVYVVPQLGVSNIFGLGAVGANKAEMSLTYGGGLEVSAWFLKK